MSHKITGKKPLQKPCNCNTQDVLPSKLDIAIAEYKEMARKAEEARDEFLQKARALEDIAKETNATANKNAILAKFDDITIDTSTLAKEVQVKDGNDTAISVGKEVRSEVGTGSDTAAETGTLFAVVKWMKDKVKAIYNVLTDSASRLAAIKTDTASAASDAAAAKTAAQAITGYATEANATSNKNAIIAKIENTQPDLSSVAKETSVKDGNDTAIGMLKDQTNGLAAIKGDAAAAKTAAQAITGYALQGTNANATNTAILTAVSSVAQSAEAYNEGKPAIATAITAKGVTTQPTDSLARMAQNIMAISQDSYTIDGGEMYAKQLFGSLESPNYWNLYDILAQLLSDGRLVNYGGILLAEYYKGYNSLALAGAGAGGAYVVSDKDENGQFKMYTEDTTHTWATEFDGKGNRWVAYCFADENHDFQITDTNTSPRSIFIGRKVGTIKLLADCRVSQIVVPDGNELVNFSSNGHSCEWNKSVCIRNLKDATGSIFSKTQSQIESVYVSGERIAGVFIGSSSGISFSSLGIIIVDAQTINSTIMGNNTYNMGANALHTIILKSSNIDCSIISNFIQAPNLRNLYVMDAEVANIKLSKGVATITQVTIGYNINDKSKSVVLAASESVLNGWAAVLDVELMQGWNKPLNVSRCVALTEANMYSHILQRLKQDEPDCGDGVTIALGQTNIDKLTSEESLALLDELTNTYGYTFA